MQKIDTILFDLDGTLVDSNNLILETFKRTFQLHFSNKILTQNDLIQMMGPPLQETFSRFSSDTNVVNSMINSYRDIYQQIEFDYVKPYPHIIETLKAFKDANFNIGIVTTKFKESAMPSINRFGIDKYIDVIIGLDDVKNHKPHAEPVLKALQYFKHQQALMVGDSPGDLQSGANAGILTCGVDWSYRRDELISLKPTFWLLDFIDLYPTVKKYNEDIKGE